MVNERSYVIRADEVSRLRKQKGLSLKSLADLAEVDPKTLRRWLNGERAFLHNVAMLADALGVQTDGLLASDDDLAVATRASEAKTYDVYFKLSVPFGDFGQERLQIFTDLLAKLVGGSVLDADFSEGSTVIRVALTEEQIKNLLALLPDFRTKAQAALDKDAPSRTIEEQLSIQRDVLPLIQAVIDVAIPDDGEGIPDEVRGKTVEVTG